MAAFMFLTHLLHCLTLTTLHLPNFEPVHLVVLLCIMTQPANIQFTTARCLQYIEAHERRSRDDYSKEHGFSNADGYPIKINKLRTNNRE